LYSKIIYNLRNLEIYSGFILHILFIYSFKWTYFMFIWKSSNIVPIFLPYAASTSGNFPTRTKLYYEERRVSLGRGKRVHSFVFENKHYKPSRSFLLWSRMEMKWYVCSMVKYPERRDKRTDWRSRKSRITWTSNIYHPFGIDLVFSWSLILTWTFTSPLKVGKTAYCLMTFYVFNTASLLLQFNISSVK